MSVVASLVIPVKRHLQKYLYSICEPYQDSIKISGKDKNIDIYMLLCLINNRKNVYFNDIDRIEMKSMDIKEYMDLKIFYTKKNEWNIEFHDPINIYYFNRIIDIKFRKEMLAYVEGAKKASGKGDLHFIHQFLEGHNITEDDIPFTTIHRYFFRNK